MTLEPVPPLDDIKPPTYSEKYFVALLIDNVVHEIFNVNGQGAARFLAQPTFKQVEFGQAGIGSVYDPVTDTFTKPYRQDTI